MSLEFTSSEMMSVTAARALTSDMTCFVGIGLPSEAANLARLTHAPDVTLIYESGTLQTKPDVLPLSIGDGELCESALTTVAVPEMFRYWLQGGHISVGFLGTAPGNCHQCKGSVHYRQAFQTYLREGRRLCYHRWLWTRRQGTG